LTVPWWKADGNAARPARAEAAPRACACVAAALAATLTAALSAAVVAAPTPPAFVATEVPGAWEGNGLAPDADGVAWYVCEVRLSPAEIGGTATLRLGRVDDEDETYFNGVRVGGTVGHQAERVYTVPASVLRVGVNRIAVRVVDRGGAGGLMGSGDDRASATPPSAPALDTADSRWALAGTWFIVAGDHPELAGFHDVADPDVLARVQPLFVGRRVMKVSPAARPEAAGEPPLALWYEQPAQRWVEALPVGNGRLGAMVFGGVESERIQLNESSVWEGNADDRNAPKAAEHWRAARELALAGKLREAQDLVQRTMMLPQDMLPRSYQPLGDLRIEMLQPEGHARDYRRQLDLETGVARTEFTLHGVRVVREVRASAPDELLVVRMRTESGQPLPPMRVQLRRKPFEADVATHAIVPGNQQVRLALGGRTQQGGVRYTALADVRAPGGTLEAKEDWVTVRDARELTICVAARTSFLERDPDAVAANDLRAAEATVPAVEARQAEWMRERMQRVHLQLGEPTAQGWLPTDERLRAFARTPGADVSLCTLYFQYARYLLLSSSRAGALPANLQGLWNEHFRAPWNADYHININLQMNYWPAGPGALAETEAPLFDLLERLAARGEVVARDLYGARGWTAHHTTDLWAFAAPEGRTVWAMLPLGGAWMTRHAWEHYLFTGDRAFLRRTAWPLMRGAAEFALDYLVPEPGTGQLIGGPGSSPENSFIEPGTGRHADLSMGTSMDLWIVRDLFENLLDAARLLDLQGDPVALRVNEALPQLATPRIGEDGRLMEWRLPFAEAEPGHRHMSHLFGLHPAGHITPDGTPDLARAARRSLEFRLEHGGGHTGWSRAWLVNFWARLHDGTRAYADLEALLSHSTLPNLFDSHPPFQIDGNFGGAAGVAEMLLQSHARAWSGGHLVHRVDLLPALPGAWEDGEVNGLVARGGVRVGMRWRGGALTQATLQAPGPGELRVRLPDSVARVRVAVTGMPPTELPVPDHLVIVPVARDPGPRTVTLEPVGSR
jgi:alpha-L-fucosidase 2